jgi:predicted AlkP superfamily pyrophosphatase or phosphodiesterase
MSRPERIILCVIDGLRPDALLQAKVPVIRQLMVDGAYTLQAQAVVPSISLPCHVSLFCGVRPARHGTLSNVWIPPQPPVSSLLDVAHVAGRSTASFYNWEELRDLSRPGSLDMACFRALGDPEGDGDLEIGATAAAYLAERAPSLAFVYLGALDEVGHRHGWMTAPYLQALEKADRAVGMICEGLLVAGLLNGSAIFVLADHAGHERDHGAATSLDLTIPWIASGAGIRKGHRIAAPVSLIDTAPTLAYLLGLPRPEEWEGQVIEEALAL